MKFISVQKALSSTKKTILMMMFSLFIFFCWLAVPHPVFPMALAVMILAIIFTFKYPFIICLLFIVFSFFRIHEVFTVLFPLHIPLLLALAMFATLSTNILTKSTKVYWSSELNIFSAFFLQVTFGIIFSTNIMQSFDAWKDSFSKIAIVVFAISWLIRKEYDFTLAARMIMIAGIVVAFYAIKNKYMGIGLVEGTRVTIGRDIGSILGDPNDLALVLLFPLSFMLAMIFTPMTGVVNKLIGLIGSIMVFQAIIATQSRGGLLGIISVFGVFMYRRIKSKTLLISLGVIALLGLMIVSGISGRESGGAHEAGIDESAKGRIYAWQAAFSMALHHPLSGVGLTNFKYNFYYYTPVWINKALSVHSTWFGVLAETGFLGFFLFVALVLSTIKSAYHNVSQILAKAVSNIKDRINFNPSFIASQQAIFAGLIGFCVSGTFLTQGFTWPLYILIGLTISSKNLIQKKNES